MLRINANYSDYYDDTDANYPAGKAVDASAPDSIDGTPWLASWFNDLNGARQALYKEAFGSLSGISGSADSANDSDVLKAILRLINRAFSEKVSQVSVTGAETVISWSALELSFDASANYAVIATAAGNYREFLPFGATAESDGVHIFARRLVDGEIVDGTRHIAWGARNWGEGLWNDFGSMDVNLYIQKIA